VIAPQVFAAAVALLGVLGLAMVSDLRHRRIPNGLVLSGLALAAGWHLLAARGVWAFDPVAPGSTGLGGALAGALILLLGFMPLYAVRALGAGDVKLMAVVGGFFGASAAAWTQLIGVSLTVLACGGVLALLRIAAARNARLVSGNLRRIMAGFAQRGSPVPAAAFDVRSQTADRMPYALAIGAGTMLYLGVRWAGSITGI